MILRKFHKYREACKPDNFVSSCIQAYNFISTCKANKSRHIALTMDCQKTCHNSFQHNSSRVAQWKRAGPITQRSEDRNLRLCYIFFSFTNFCSALFTRPKISHEKELSPVQQQQSGAVEACWAQNPEVRGSKPPALLNFCFTDFALHCLQYQR